MYRLRHRSRTAPFVPSMKRQCGPSTIDSSSFRFSRAGWLRWLHIPQKLWRFRHVLRARVPTILYPLEEWYEARGIFAPSTPFTCLTAVRTGTCNVGRSCTGEQIQPIGRTKNSLRHHRARNKARRPRGEGVQLQAMHKRYLALQSLWHLVTHGVSHRQHEGMNMWTCVLRMKREIPGRSAWFGVVRVFSYVCGLARRWFDRCVNVL